MNFELIYIFKCVRFGPNTFDYLYSAYYHVSSKFGKSEFWSKVFHKNEFSNTQYSHPQCIIYRKIYMCKNYNYIHAE